MFNLLNMNNLRFSRTKSQILVNMLQIMQLTKIHNKFWCKFPVIRHLLQLVVNFSFDGSNDTVQKRRLPDCPFEYLSHFFMRIFERNPENVSNGSRKIRKSRSSIVILLTPSLPNNLLASLIIRCFTIFYLSIFDVKNFRQRSRLQKVQTMAILVI